MPNMKDVDFSAMATAYGVKCADGLTINKGSFSHQDGEEVPIVFQHNHKDINNVIGHGILKDQDNGMRIYAYLNQDTSAGRQAKALLQHGDLKAVSIYANNLTKTPDRKTVTHGNIREVSLVLSPANPGAIIDYVALEHSDGTIDIDEDSAYIFNGLNVEITSDEINHSDDNLENKGENNMANTNVEEKKANQFDELFNSLPDEMKKNLFASMLNLSKENESVEHADKEPAKNDKAIKEIFDTLNEEQKQMVYALIGLAIEDAKKNGSVKQSEFDEEGEDYMNHNVFESDANQEVLSHDQINEIFADAQKCGSLRDSVVEHTATYGVDNIDYLFPNNQVVGEPTTIKRKDGWVSKLLDAVSKRPFSRIKSLHFNLKADEARAKGYIKHSLKAEEVIAALKRETNPQTIYKKQTLDRDDILEITDFNIVAYLKNEMHDMLNEELGRAILIGDGRTSDSADKISETNIRPIAKDVDTYTIKEILTISDTATNKVFTDAMIEGALHAKEEYLGSGSCMMFAAPKYINKMLLCQDTIGRRIYSTRHDVALALDVTEILDVPVMNGATMTYGTGAAAKTYDILGIIVNPKDYIVGAHKAGQMAMFDDFDIDYNTNKYLLETRCSGAMVTPYGAIVLLKEHTSAAG